MDYRAPWDSTVSLYFKKISLKNWSHKHFYENTDIVDLEQATLVWYKNLSIIRNLPGSLLSNKLYDTIIKRKMADTLAVNEKKRKQAEDDVHTSSVMTSAELLKDTFEHHIINTKQKLQVPETQTPRSNVALTSSSIVTEQKVIFSDITNKGKSLEDEHLFDDEYALFREENEPTLIDSIDDENLQDELKLPNVESISVRQLLKEELRENFYKYQKKIPKSKKIVTPAYWGVLDLTRETNELNDRLMNNASQYFANKINWNPKCTPSVLQAYFDGNCEEKIDKYETLHDNIRFIKSNMSHFKRDLSEEELKMTTMFPLFRGIFSSGLVDDKWGEIQSLATNEARNKTNDPLQRARVGRKADMRGILTCAPIKFEVLYGEVSGGLIQLGLSASSRKKRFLDKVKLTIMMRDSINRVLDEWKNLNDDERSSLIIFGWTQVGFDINLYAMNWEGNGIYLFGLVDKCRLPTERDDCGIFEDIYCILKELE
ncbi:4893_t:CDS:2, partial [Funneliformis geosporum]